MHTLNLTDGQLEYLQDLVMFAYEMQVPEQKGWDIQTYDNLVDEVMKWSTYNQAGYVRNMETYGLRNMIRALSIMELLNTEEENQRLALAKAEIKRRRASS